MLRARTDLPIRNEQADLEFKAILRKRYSEQNAQQAIAAPQHQWNNTRFLLQSPLFSRRGRALEFGCDLGSSAIMLAALGWKVTGIDVRQEPVSLAKLNAARYGVDSEFLYVPDSEYLPFEDATFDLVFANSVLEYIYPRSLLSGVYREIDRVLKPGGILFVAGTSNRLMPKEVHSHRWLVNYTPEKLMERIKPDRHRQWGLWPWEIRNAFPGYRDLLREDKGAALLQAKRASGWSATKLIMLSVLNTIARILGTSAGAFLPSICFVLQKAGAEGETTTLPLQRRRA